MFGRFLITGAALALGLTLTAASALAQAATPQLSDAEMEQFLRTARVIAAKPVGIGITNSLRATLSDGRLTHDAHIQTVEEFKSQFRTDKGLQLNFTDSWRYNVAAYKLDRMLDMRLVPVSVQRNWNGMAAAFTWWVDDVAMDERKRLARQLRAPNSGCWAVHSQTLRMFDQLIENTDRNLGNTLISSNWRIWAIDHTRAFRQSPTPQTAELTTIDRTLLARLEALDRKTLQKAIGKYVSGAEIGKLLDRRDALVAHYRTLGVHGVVDRTAPELGCNVMYTDPAPASTPR